MPYKIIHVPGGFQVADKKGKVFSNKPLTKDRAMRQRIAIALSESKLTGKPTSAFFV